MESDDEPCFTVHDKPEVMFNSRNLHNRLVSVPFIGVEIKHRQEFKPLIIKKRGKSGTPVCDGGVRNPDVKSGTKDETDVSERVFTEVEHGKRRDDEENRVSHSLEIGLSKQSRHGRRGDDVSLEHKK